MRRLLFFWIVETPVTLAVCLVLLPTVFIPLILAYKWFHRAIDVQHHATAQKVRQV